jgi:exonuclease SbcD
VPRPLSTITGELDDLLADPRYDDTQDHWIQATLTDAVRPDRPMERLRMRFPHTLVLSFAPAGEPAPSVVAEAPRGRSDHQVTKDFVAAMRGAPADEDESALLMQACDACAEDPDADLLVSASGSG